MAAFRHIHPPDWVERTDYGLDVMHGALAVNQKRTSIVYAFRFETDNRDTRGFSDIMVAIIRDNFFGCNVQFLCYIEYIAWIEDNILAVFTAFSAAAALERKFFVYIYQVTVKVFNYILFIAHKNNPSKY
jgi:hypothetical protein